MSCVKIALIGKAMAQGKKNPPFFYSQAMNEEGWTVDYERIDP